MKISEIFHFNQGHQITDEEIYHDLNNGLNKIPVITGDNEIKGYGSKSIIQDSDLPCVTYPTKGNSGVCHIQNKIFDANNTAIIIAKNEWKEKISLEWISFKLSRIFLDIATSKGGVSYLNKEIVENIDINIPPKDKQEKEYVPIYKLLELRNKVDLLIDKIVGIKHSVLAINYKKHQAREIPIETIFDCMRGNTGLTEEFLYSQIQNMSERKYRILTGSIDFSSSQFIHRCRHPKNSGELINVIEGKPIIHVVRKGRAGNVSYFDIGNYTANDDTYLLYLKDDIKQKINLKWLMYQLRQQFLDYSSSSDNGTWNMTGFFKNVKVDIPSVEEQEEIVKNYQKFELLENGLIGIKNAIEDLLSKEIS